jgi:hypothetical protein
MTPRLCYQCDSFNISKADYEYNWEMSCQKEVWDFDSFDDGVNKFRGCLETAQRCKTFKPRYGVGIGRK